jgi:hypothetical protein
VLLTSRVPGQEGNNVTYSVALTAASSATTVQISVTTGGATLAGGGDAAKVAPGSLVSIQANSGTQLAFQSAAAPADGNPLPTDLGGTQVYFNGIAAPLMMVSPDKVVAQVPWEIADTTSINAVVRSARPDGSVQVTSAVAVSIVPANPGIFAMPNTQPSVGVVYHGSSTATGIISVDGTAKAGDVATVTIEDRTYNYTVQTGDTLDTIRDALVVLVNQDPKVRATPSGVFDRILLQARVQGPEGNNIPYGATASAGASVIMTAIGSQLCCANVADTLVTTDNPAIPGEMIYVLATGVGLPVLTDSNKQYVTTGLPYPPPPIAPQTSPQVAMNSIAGGKTADVISATLLPNTVGMYKVLLHLNPDLPTDPFSQLTIAQDIYVSNIVTLPIVNVSGSQ